MRPTFVRGYTVVNESFENLITAKVKSHQMFMQHSYSAVENTVYSKIYCCISYQYVFSEKTVSGKSGQLLFCDENFP